MTSIREFLDNLPPESEPNPMEETHSESRTFRLTITRVETGTTELWKDSDEDMVETSMYWHYAVPSGDTVGDVYEFTIRKVGRDV